MSITIPISQFKQHCLEIMQKLESNKEHIVITKRDKPIATVAPYSSNTNSLFGALKNKAEIKGNIIEPVNEKWDADNE